MSLQQAESWTRRRFLGGLTLAGTAALLGVHPRPVAAEPPPETTTLRLAQGVGLCVAPQYVAEELLQAEGFIAVHSVKTNTVRDIEMVLASGDAHLGMHFAAPLVVRLDQADPITILAGVHAGCFELFGTERIRTIRDLKGKTVAVPDLQTGPITFLASMVAYVGLEPRKDITWVTHPRAEAKQLLAEGKIDAFLGFPPDPQELRAKKIGSVVVNSAVDRPWSQYFCCLMTGNREFVRKHPAATKRALRAILKADQVCALEPERAARLLVDKGFTPSYDYALQTMKDVPYGKWREYDPEDTLRFYALRLHEAGMITSSPQKLIAQGTDWRFLHELKRELKG
jgi:NitT/TauT family transport system substrate-binding protein